MKTESPPLNLLEIAQDALAALEPVNWIGKIKVPEPRTAVICWGKAAFATARAYAEKRSREKFSTVKIPTLVIGPRDGGAALPEGAFVFFGEHPLPGAGSFAAGVGLLEFFDQLRREGVKRLDVYLSGGASSLAWLPFPGMDRSELAARLESLYDRPLPIQRLNAERSELDQLKAGGTAFWLRALAPEVRARVWVVSDVMPFGPEVVGSGPFWDGHVRHSVVADNRSWVRGIVRGARHSGFSVWGACSGRLGSWEWGVERVSAEISRALAGGARSGVMVFGGEPQVDLREGRRAARSNRRALGLGGRQTQIAAALLAKWAPEIARGRVEILCLSSDGVDGRSGAAGAWLTRAVAQHALANLSAISVGVARFDSASVLGCVGALVPTWRTGTNVQDAVVVRVGLGSGLR